jgi:hypothetical protein
VDGKENRTCFESASSVEAKRAMLLVGCSRFHGGTAKGVLSETLQ